jgi:hypothetical protein
LEDGEKKSTKWKTYQVGWNIMFGGMYHSVAKDVMGYKVEKL